MVFIIPDIILEELTCHLCQKYLSVKPVKICEDGMIRCGRCSEGSNVGAVSTYNVIVDNGLFRCVNRYDGCEKLLTYSDARIHEADCFSRLYECPRCPDQYRLSSFLLLNHFKKEHVESILDEPKFIVDLLSEYDYQKWYLYKIEDCIFFVYIRYILNEEFLHLQCYSVREEKVASNIRHNFVIFSENNELVVSTAHKPCSALGSNNHLLGYNINTSEINYCRTLTIKFKVDITNVIGNITLPSTSLNFVDTSVQTESITNNVDHFGRESVILLYQHLRKFYGQFEITTIFVTGCVILALIFILIISLELLWLLTCLKEYFAVDEKVENLVLPEPEPKGIEILDKWFSNNKRENKNNESLFTAFKTLLALCLYVIHNILNGILGMVDNVIKKFYRE